MSGTAEFNFGLYGFPLTAGTQRQFIGIQQVAAKKHQTDRRSVELALNSLQKKIHILTS